MRCCASPCLSRYNAPASWPAERRTRPMLCAAKSAPDSAVASEPAAAELAAVEEQALPAGGDDACFAGGPDIHDG